MLVESSRGGAGVRAMRLARQAGYRVRLLTRDPAYYGDADDSPVRIADVVERADTFDATSILEHLDVSRTKALMTFTDYYLVPTALAALALGCPAASPLGLLNARLKDRTRCCLQACGGNPWFRIVPPDLPLRDLDPLAYPCVVKPVDDSGSHDVRICADRAEMVAALASVRERTHNARGYPLSGRALIEAYVPGPEFSAEALWDPVDSNWRILGYTRKQVSPPPFAFEIGHVFPHVFPDAEAKAIEAAVRSWLSAIGHAGTAAHVEFRLPRPATPICMEINPRLGGDRIDALIRRALGIDPVDGYLRLHLGLPWTGLESNDHRQVAQIRFVLPSRAGTVVAVHSRGPAEPGLEVCLPRFDPRPVAGDGRIGDRLGYVIACGQDAGQVGERVDHAMNGIYIEYG